MSTEPESLMLQLLRDMRREIGAVHGEVASLHNEVADLRADVADMRSEMTSLRADVASDLVAMQAESQKARRETSDQIVGLRRAVVEYHTSVIGHGILISELEARVRRVEQHLDLPAIDSH